MVSLRKIGVALGIAAAVLLTGPSGTADAADGTPDMPTLSERIMTHEALRLLIKLGYDAGAVDATMTLDIDGAVRDFQRRHGLEVDGEITAALLASLRKAKQ